jgi:heme-degrading monooxygenase HmoA
MPPSGSVALVFSYDTDEPEAFERAYGPGGEWASFFSRGEGYDGTELLRDLEQPGRYVVIDRWASREAYNAFVEGHRDEYMRRVDETVFLYRQELRLGTFARVEERGRVRAEG